MTNSNSHHELLRLLPQPKEAVLSWLTRLCIGYAETPAGVSEYLGVGIGDCVETKVTDCSVDRILHVTKYNKDIFQLSRLVSKNVDQMGVSRNFFMVAEMESHLRFRFCPKCMQYDSIPNFKVDWCFDFVRFCFNHKCLLESSCPHCKADVYLPYRLQNRSKKSVEIVCLSQCQKCGLLLYKTNPVQCKELAKYPKGSEQLEHLRNGMAVMASLVHGYGKTRETGRRMSLDEVGAYIKKGLCPNTYSNLNPSIYREKR
ncbi:MAG: hypothetical protein A0129_13500 [Limnobacter sp. CACIAM 66H1]|uniref:TniQ family protein n=1 Tax=Limnobacter sp. CACIAM 66H1 TaxID=1813033 RepID=UPI0007A8BA93|nr:TniQ family protein [Limnobacter sp. CACIAM 66H1]KYP10310.1 MAG: hypothetical protein A0129_13500 [Limnobacter sp. CACIAM 66H1]